MTVRVSRKGDLIELNGGAFRLERVVLTEEGAERNDESTAWKLYRRSDTNGEDQPTSYTYRYDIASEFDADGEEAAIDEAKRLVAAEA